MSQNSRLPQLLAEHQDELIESWFQLQLGAGTLRPDLMSEGQLREESGRFVRLLRVAVADGVPEGLQSDRLEEVRAFLVSVSQARARLGYSPVETATFVFSLKETLFALLRRHVTESGALVQEFWTATQLLDKLGLFTTEVHQKAREELIERQREEMFELSTPVVTLADGILALPLIGTLDSARTESVMENLLQRIVAEEARVAIIDITGVPLVDTLTAQHLLKTITATRLMGADCIISGIRPQIAQTIVHLGVDLGKITTKATLAGALAVALQRIGRAIVDVRAKA